MFRNNFWSGREFYGEIGLNSLVLLERYFAKCPGDANRVVISIKGGSYPEVFEFDASPDKVRGTLDESIAQLNGRKTIDMFAFGRVNPNVPLGYTFRQVRDEFIKPGKIRGITLSEPSADTIHEAVKHTKILAVEVELSMFAPEPLENGVAIPCTQYGIPLIAQSLIGRGRLKNLFKKWEDIPKDSPLLQINSPRFQLGNFGINLELSEKVMDMASTKGCTPPQLAINWTRALAKRRGMLKIIPSPEGMTVAQVEENSKLIDITDEEMAQIGEILAKFPPAELASPNLH